MLLFRYADDMMMLIATPPRYTCRLAVMFSDVLMLRLLMIDIELTLRR